MKIQRKRFIAMRNNRTEVWCGLARNYQFKKIDEIGNTSIKTWLSENKAKLSCSSWDRDFEIVPIVETIEIDEKKCYNCLYYDGNYENDSAFCDIKETYVSKCNHCCEWSNRDYSSF